MTAPSLQIDDIHVHYGKFPAVRGVSMKVEPGEISLCGWSQRCWKIDDVTRHRGRTAADAWCDQYRRC